MNITCRLATFNQQTASGQLMTRDPDPTQPDLEPEVFHTVTRRHSQCINKHVKKFFYVYLFWSRFLRFLTFYFPNVFYFKKNVRIVQSGKQINNKHFQINSNEIDL